MGIPKRDATMMTAATQSSTQKPAQHNTTAIEDESVLTLASMPPHAHCSTRPCYCTSTDVAVLVNPQTQRQVYLEVVFCGKQAHYDICGPAQAHQHFYMVLWAVTSSAAH